jgi:hypothetical protein
MRGRCLPAVVLAVLAVALGGCGFSNPYQTTSTTTRAATRPAATPTTPGAKVPADQRDPASERDGTIPKQARAAQEKLAVRAASSSPQATLERYASIYLNWDAARVVAIQHQLAAISLGPARAQAQQAAASAGRDRQLTSSRVANRGRVIAISPGQAAAAGRWVIVTSEQTSGQGDYQGLPTTLHVIYAQLTNTSQGWVVSQWQPQN